MEPLEDTLGRLREAFRTGRTRPAEFRAAQLQGLSRFLQDNKQLLQEALAQDLRKVRAREAGAGAGQGHGDSFILHEVELQTHPTPPPSLCCNPLTIHSFISPFTQPFIEHVLCARYRSGIWGCKRE